MRKKIVVTSIFLILAAIASVGVNYNPMFVTILVILFVAHILLQLIKSKVKFKRELVEWVETFLVAGILAYFIQSFVIQAFKIPSGSMLETLQLSDHLFANKFVYGTKIPFTNKKILVLRQVQRGDIVIFKYPLDPKKDFVKRCIGLPGDTIEIRQKVLYRNKQRVEEPFIIHKDSRVFPNDPVLPYELRIRDNFGPIVVPPGEYFMMGDNRDNSSDSRYWGFLPEKNIKGKAWFIYWPLRRIMIIR